MTKTFDLTTTLERHTDPLDDYEGRWTLLMLCKSCSIQYQLTFPTKDSAEEYAQGTTWPGVKSLLPDGTLVLGDGYRVPAREVIEIMPMPVQS